jgi:hypothetical protein
MIDHLSPESSPDLETQVGQLLDELSRVQAEMLEVLAAKREKMASNDLEGVASLQPRVEDLCQRLQNCYHRRGALLATSASGGRRADSLGALIGQLPGERSRELTAQARNVSQQMRLVQLQTVTNWVLAQRSLLHLAQLLEIIATGGRLQPTYGRDDSPATPGALVDREI